MPCEHKEHRTALGQAVEALATELRPWLDMPWVEKRVASCKAAFLLQPARLRPNVISTLRRCLPSCQCRKQRGLVALRRVSPGRIERYQQRGRCRHLWLTFGFGTVPPEPSQATWAQGDRSAAQCLQKVHLGTKTPPKPAPKLDAFCMSQDASRRRPRPAQLRSRCSKATERKDVCKAVQKFH